MDEDLDALEASEGDLHASLRDAITKARQARRELAHEREVSRETAATAKARKAEVHRLRGDLALARAWAWAQWHGLYNTHIVDPHALQGAGAPPGWLLSGQPPWPADPVDTSAVPDQLLGTLLGMRDATPEELAEARRRIETPRPPGQPFVLSADLDAEDDQGNGFTVVEADEFRPDQVFPGARLPAGRAGTERMARVLRTELLEATDGRVTVLVTFVKDHDATT